MLVLVIISGYLIMLIKMSAFIPLSCLSEVRLVLTAFKECCQIIAVPPLTSTWPHLRCDVGLEEGEYRENCLSCSIVYYYNGAQRYEQFLQVGQLYQALILLSLALFRAPLCLRSSLCYICIKFFFAYILLFTF